MDTSYITSDGLNVSNSKLTKTHRSNYQYIYLYRVKDKKKFSEYGQLQYISSGREFENWFRGEYKYMKEFFDWIVDNFIHVGGRRVERRKYQLKDYLKMAKRFIKTHNYRKAGEGYFDGSINARRWAKKFGIETNFNGRYFVSFEKKPDWIENIDIMEDGGDERC